MRKKTTICLNMIVKNESHVIRRCLASIKHLIDYWVIVDTGSTDGTQDTIREYLRDIPGELHERPWVNFGHNRNEALALARSKGDYFLFIDADDKIVYEPSFALPKLDKDYYYIMQNIVYNRKEGSPSKNPRPFLIKDLPDFLWSGALHEILLCYPNRTFEFIEGAINEYIHDGDRSKDPKRHEKDVQMLEESIKKGPYTSRDVFYLAQTYRGQENNTAALKMYENRAAMEGQGDETFYALFCIGCLQKTLNYPSEICWKSFCRAYLFRPSRAESLFQMTHYLMDSDNYFLGYLVAKYAIKIPHPPLLEVFHESWVYDWGIAWQLYTCCIRIGKKSQARKTLQILLDNPRLPASIRSELEMKKAHA